MCSFSAGGSVTGHHGPTTPTVPLEEQELAVQACRDCALADTRTHTVFGSGNPHARVVLVGEAPGKNEDLQGYPFVGAAGKKLDGMLERAGLRREDIYIANVLKCRPPQNRNPTPEEIRACAPFLRAQIKRIWPDVIVCLGNFAAQFVLKTDKGVTALRGNLYKTGHFVVCPTFHPAACIYHPAWQELLEADLAMTAAWLAANPPAGPDAGSLANHGTNTAVEEKS